MKKKSGSIHMIHPTQVAVGYAEVAVKMDELLKYEKDGELQKYLKSKIIPCVLGPDNIVYITDHHHLGLALTVLAHDWDKENPKKSNDNPFVSCNFNILYDFSKSKLPRKEFFKVLDSLNFLHSFDENGQKVDAYENIPKRLIDLQDDPYRSLAGFVRKSGGYNKVEIHYIEFMWADYFRTQLPIEEVEKNFKKAVLKAIPLALSDEAQTLPGWKGVEILKNLKTGFIDKIKANKKDINESTNNIKASIGQAKESSSDNLPLKFK